MAPNPRALALLLILLIFLLSPDPSSSSSSSQPTRHGPHQPGLDVLAREHAALAVLNRSNYNDLDPAAGRFLNLTGFRAGDGLAWAELEGVGERVAARLARVVGEEAKGAVLSGAEGAVLDVYRNLSGVVAGRWVRCRGVEIVVPVAAVGNGSEVVGGGGGPFQRNVTGGEGMVRVLFKEREVEYLPVVGGAKEVKAQVTLLDEEAGRGWEMDLHGVHWVDSGVVILTTTSEKFAGIFGLPHFALSPAMFRQATTLLNETIRRVIEAQEGFTRVMTNPWSSAGDGSADGMYSPPHCEYIVYLLQHPLVMPPQAGQWNANEDQHPLDFVENELRHPSGFIHVPPPKMKMEAVIFSPDCGFALESKGPPDYAPIDGEHLVGPKIEVITATGRWLSLLYSAVLCGQIYLSMLQMKEAATPSTRSRISFYTVALLSMGDGFTAMAFLPLGMFLESMFLNFLAVSFFAFFAVTFLDLRFLMDIWTVQDEERRRQARQQSSSREPGGDATPLLPVSPAIPATSANTATSDTAATPPAALPTVSITAAGADLFPLATATRQNVVEGASPTLPPTIIIPPDQDEPAPDDGPDDAANETPARRFGALYSRFYALLLVIVFLSLHATSWPLALRRAYTNLLAFLYLSPWLPQIHRNAARNCRKALLWRYVAGHSALRLAPVAYFYGVSDNVLFVEPDRHALLLLAVWIWIQICALGLQALLGPRVLLARSWLPPAWDYHPVLRDDDEEEGGGGGGALPVVGFGEPSKAPGGARSTTIEKRREGGARGLRVFGCAICMQDVEVVTVASPAAGEAAGGGGAARLNLLARRAYMVTPCRHVFHSRCLEGWMRFRLQCPICRETLPPL